MTNNYESKQTGSNGMTANLAYLLVGGGIGAAVALLFAPKPGKELRHDASAAVKQGMVTANKTVSQLKETAGDYYQKAQEKASELYGTAFKAASDGTDEAKALADNVLGQAEEMISDAGPEDSAQDPPIFESGKKPFDQRNIKTNIL